MDLEFSKVNAISNVCIEHYCSCTVEIQRDCEFYETKHGTSTNRYQSGEYKEILLLKTIDLYMKDKQEDQQNI